MKGPGLRLEHDIRRKWTCSTCGRSVRDAVHIVSRRCDNDGCDGWMAMEERVRPSRGYEPHVVAEAPIEQFGIEEQQTESTENAERETSEPEQSSDG